MTARAISEGILMALRDSSRTHCATRKHRVGVAP